MRTFGWLTAALFLGALGCSERTSRSTTGWDVWVVGCAELRAWACELNPTRELTFWLPESEPPRVTVASDVGALRVKKTFVQGGTRVELSVPVGAKRLVLTDGAREFVQALREPHEDTVFTRALTLRDQRKYDEARALLTPLLNDPDAERKARAQGALARISLREQRIDQAITELQEALSLSRAAGLTVAVRADAMALAHTSYRRWDLTTMRTALEAIPAHDRQGRVEALRYWAFFALFRGDLENALTQARTAQRHAERVALKQAAEQAAQLELQVLTELGRVADGRRRVKELDQQAGDDACERAQLAANEGWLELSPFGDPARAKDASARAVALYRSACHDPFHLANALVNLALSAYRLGALAEAKALLGEAHEAGEVKGWVLSWERYLDGAIALSEGRPEAALALYRELVARSELGAPLADLHRALVGLGRSLAALGKREEAIEALMRAERVLDEETRRAPLGEGRETFSESRSESSSELVRLLVDAGAYAEALDVARWARVRPLVALVERSRTRSQGGDPAGVERALSAYLAARAELERLTRDAWAVPIAELPALEQNTAEARRALQAALERVLSFGAPVAPKAVLPERAEGELGLYFLPVGDEMFAFARSREGVTVERVALAALPEEPAALAARFLGPLTPRLTEARFVRVVAYGPMRDWDVHAWPVADGVLMDKLPVVYGTELSTLERARVEVPRALVVKNPRRDLPHATREGALVSSLLRAHGLSVTELSGRGASRAALLSALPQHDIFHYAGHAEQLGFAGWESRLLLASREQLEVSDVLALERVPSFVVLSGCETGLESRDAGFSLGMAQAFIARGSELVLATTRRVPDALGEKLAGLMYRDGSQTFRAESLTEALRSLRREESALGEWPSYRLYVR